MNNGEQHIQTIVEKYYQIEIVKDPDYFRRQEKKRQQHNADQKQNPNREGEK